MMRESSMRWVLLVSLALNCFLIGYMSANKPPVARFGERMMPPERWAKGPDGEMMPKRPMMPPSLFVQAVPPEQMEAHMAEMDAMKQEFVAMLLRDAEPTKEEIEAQFDKADAAMERFRELARDEVIQRILGMSKDERKAAAERMRDELR